MKRFLYLFIIVLIVAGVVLAAFAPDAMSLGFTLIMDFTVIFGVIFGLIPTIRYISGISRGRESIVRAGQVQSDSAWVSASQMNEFFYDKNLDKIFFAYRSKVEGQRKAGQIMSDIDDYINEDILALLTWYNVVSILPGTLTGLGILGTFIGLILGINTIGFGSVDAALESVQGLLKGINIAFYTSISGVILSILFNISYSILRNIMNRELGVFVEEFHKNLVPSVEEQSRYRERREIADVIKLLERLPKNAGFSTSNSRAEMNQSGNKNEAILMPQILEGLKKDEFVFYLQPKYELNTRQILAAEALVRWKHPTLGMLPPSSFIPILETNGYITKLDQYLWESVCKTIRRWMDQGVHVSPIAINVSKTDILAMDIAGFFRQMLAKYQIPPRYLEIEIAEKAYLETHNVVLDVEKALISQGIRVILDGFNGDFIALGNLSDIQADTFKLDLRFLEETGYTVEAVFDKARTLHLNMTVEGIENAEQLNRMRKCGCTEGQGYYFSMPMTVDSFQLSLDSEQDSDSKNGS